MTDIKSPEERSINMSKIRSRDTKPEVWLRKRLFERGYRYRKNVSNVPGHPDAWLAKYNTAVFVHGCFWHRHEGCKYAYTPKSRIDFWTEKFQKNVERDRRVSYELEQAGIRRLVVWECTVKKMLRDEATLNQILENIDRFLKSEETKMEI
ncbi:MAG: DNA mismatch endonuclease Vsr [Eubacterium sp.]|nr:DNA mismatch endonuclease Vsr [Eubacterium sp.]